MIRSSRSLAVRTLAIGLTIAAAFTLVACKKKAGDSCSGSEALCEGNQAILECHDGKLVKVACLGAKGCSQAVTGVQRSGRTTTTNYAVTCDFSGNPVGSDCTDDEALCAADKSMVVSCKNKKIEQHLCRGPGKCSETATTIECDDSIQIVGDPCEGTDYACSPDKKQQLSCKGKAFALESNCRGPKGCYNEGKDTIRCDLGGQNVGEGCDDGFACSVDGKALLKCAAKKWAVDEKCKKKCAIEGNSVGCT